jgi:hypothetical protein
MTVSTFEDFRQAIVAHLDKHGMTRNDLAMRLERKRILRAHSVRCILSDAPSLRRNGASFKSVCAIAGELGLSLSLSTKNEKD